MVAEPNDRALRRWWHLPPKPIHRVVLAAIVAVIAITATFSAALVNHWGPFGPLSAQPVEPISVQAVGTNGTTATPLAGAVVTVFSLLPVSGSSGTPSSAGVAASEVLLWQGTTGSDGIARGDLGSAFGSIARNWAVAASPLTASVSLLVEASYVTINATTHLSYVYSYTNYLPYSPRAPPISFQIAVAFDLADPVEQVVGPAAGPGDGVTQLAAPCPGPFIDWTTTYDMDFTGPFPLLMVNNTDRTQSDLPYVVITQDFIGSRISFDFTGAGAEASTSGVTAYMTSGASWSSGSESLSALGAGAAALANGNYSIGMIYIPGVTLNVLHQTETFNYYIPNFHGGCVNVRYVLQFVRLSIVNVAGSEWNVSAASFPAAYGQMIAGIEQGSTGGAWTAANISLSSGNSYLWVNMTAEASGYSNVADLEAAVTGALSVFDTGLAVGLAVMDAFDICGLFCSGADIVEGLSIFGTALGVALQVASLCSSVSFSTTVQQNYNIVTLTSDNGGFHDQLLEAPAGTTLTTTNGTASAHVPLNVVAWPF